MVTIRHKGNFSKTEQFLNKVFKKDYLNILDRFGAVGVEMLASATPKDTGKTASSWGYSIKQGHGTTSIEFTNSHIEKGVNIAIILQYGHGTGSGGYVRGRDYINPALQPVFDKMAEEVWREVTSL